MTGADLLALLMPPLALVDKLDHTPNLPESIKVWHKRMKDIRGDGPSDIDGAGKDTYDWLFKTLDEYFTPAEDIKPAVQASLLVEEEKAGKVKVY